MKTTPPWSLPTTKKLLKDAGVINTFDLSENGDVTVSRTSAGWSGISSYRVYKKGTSFKNTNTGISKDYIEYSFYTKIGKMEALKDALRRAEHVAGESMISFPLSRKGDDWVTQSSIDRKINSYLESKEIKS